MILGKHFLTIIVIAVVKMAVGTSVCTYKRCKTCELIKETSESEEPMFMVTKKAVSQLGSACELMLRNDSRMQISKGFYAYGALNAVEFAQIFLTLKGRFSYHSFSKKS